MGCCGFCTRFYGIHLLLVFLLLVCAILNTRTVLAAVEKDTRESSADSMQKTVGAPSNLPAAVLWYQEKAKDGDAEAQYNLGNVYEVGFGVEVSYELAAKWYEEAAEQEHQLAQLKLGILYILGKGVRESTLKGGKWIRAAAK